MSYTEIVRNWYGNGHAIISYLEIIHTQMTRDEISQQMSLLHQMIFCLNIYILAQLGVI